MAKKVYKRYKYSKSQIARNRTIFLLCMITVVGLSIWGIGTLVGGVEQPLAADVGVSENDESNTDTSDSTQDVDAVDTSDSSQSSDSSDLAGDSTLSTDVSDSETDESESGSEGEETVDMTYPGDEPPMLVNKQNYIPEGFEPSLSGIGDYQFATQGMQALKDMMNAAALEGINLWIVSAYRTNERQTNNYNARVDSYLAEGKTEEEAKELTEQFIAPPGTSEHTIGLAVDFNSLYQSFEDTPEFEWLYENCATFGFILRYPKDKVAVTGFSYEPWHYRFVGTNHSHEIMENGYALEEYLSANY